MIRSLRCPPPFPKELHHHYNVLHCQICLRITFSNKTVETMKLITIVRYFKKF